MRDLSAKSVCVLQESGEVGSNEPNLLSLYKIHYNLDMSIDIATVVVPAAFQDRC